MRSRDYDIFHDFATAASHMRFLVTLSHSGSNACGGVVKVKASCIGVCGHKSSCFSLDFIVFRFLSQRLAPPFSTVLGMASLDGVNMRTEDSTCIFIFSELPCTEW